MTIAEAERFYEQDTKKYEVEKNKEFLKWLKLKSQNCLKLILNLKKKLKF